MMPSGWTEKKLGELCNVAIGKTPNRGSKEYWDTTLQTDNTWLSIADLSFAKNKIVDTSTERISDAAVPIMTRVVKGTLLLSFKLTIGRVAFAGKDLYTNEAIAQLPIKSDVQIDKYYLYYYLSAFDYETLLKGDIKVKGKSLNKQKLNILPVYYPSLLEQQRIVEKLDILFADIEKEKQIVQQKLQNAKDLFESALSKLLATSTQDLVNKTLDEVCAFERGLTYSKQDERDFSSNVVLRANNIDLDSHSLNFDELKYIDDAIDIPQEKKVTKNAILICVSSGSKSHLGKVAFIDKDYGYAFGGFMGLIKVKPEILPKYLYYVLISPEFKKLISNLTDGANINNLKYSDISKFVFNLPTIPEQQSIVQKLDALYEHVKFFEETNAKQLSDLDELKQSILKKAFNGEL